MRYRLARLLVGNFVRLPDHDGVFIVQQFTGPRRWHVIYEAATFRLKIRHHLPSYDEDPADRFEYRPSRRVGRFVGTVKP